LSASNAIHDSNLIAVALDERRVVIMSQSLTHTSEYVPDASSFEVIPLEQLKDPLVRLGVDYWRMRRGGRRHPAREDLQPRDIKSILRNVALVKVLDGGADYECRIVGDAQVNAFSLRMQNRRLSEISADAPVFGGIVQSIFAHIMQQSAPSAIRGRIGRDIPEANFTDVESALLPLGATDNIVDHIAVVSSYVMRTFSTYRM
jgi:hypothetical protein